MLAKQEPHRAVLGAGSGAGSVCKPAHDGATQGTTDAANKTNLFSWLCEILRLSARAHRMVQIRLFTIMSPLL